MHAGAVYDAPDVYIALGQVGCARFSDGESFDEVAQELLADLAGSHPTDDQRLIGAVLGAATRTICPEHADKV